MQVQVALAFRLGKTLPELVEGRSRPLTAWDLALYIAHDRLARTAAKPAAAAPDLAAVAVPAKQGG
jgi:hypothetical protein